MLMKLEVALGKEKTFFRGVLKLKMRVPKLRELLLWFAKEEAGKHLLASTYSCVSSVLLSGLGTASALL